MKGSTRKYKTCYFSKITERICISMISNGLLLRKYMYDYPTQHSGVDCGAIKMSGREEKAYSSLESSEGGQRIESAKGKKNLCGLPPCK